MSEQENFYNELLEDLEQGKIVLPTLPDVSLRVNDLASNPDAELADLSAVIVTDPALSAQLIRVSNSALYRGRYPVDNVQTAVSRLGLKLVKNLVSSLVMEQMFQSTPTHLEQRLQDLWHKSVEVASISHVLASKEPALQADEAMLAGLLHDIGVLPILVKAGQNPELLRDTQKLDALIHSLSSRIGVAILRSWDFPESLITVVAEQNDFTRDSVDGPDLVDVVQVANLQSHFNLKPILGIDELEAVPAFRKLGVQTDVQVVELEENSEEYAEAMALFGLAS